jgi:hypothetical protein
MAHFSPLTAMPHHGIICQKYRDCLGVNAFAHKGAQHLLLVPCNFSRGRGVIPSLAERGEQSCQRGYYQFGMLRLGVRSGV